MPTLRLALIALALPAAALAQEHEHPTGPATKSTCVAGAYREFNFVIGDWDTFDMAAPTKVVARNHVTPMLGGCAIREVYEQLDGLSGESFTTYDLARRVWHQSWVTNRGQLLLLEGGLQNGRMVLTATEHGFDGRTSLLRGTWWPEGKNVREKAERSTDGGKTWTPVFDIIFRPHRPAGR
jgi:hypothetical protein